MCGVVVAVLCAECNRFSKIQSAWMWGFMCVRGSVVSAAGVTGGWGARGVAASGLAQTGLLPGGLLVRW